MKHLPLDDGTADRLLAGALAPDDAPAGYAEVARLVRAARGPVTGDELLPLVPVDPTAAPATVITFAAARRRRTAVRVAAAAAAIVALTGTAAAAASGGLPGPAQRALSRASNAVGFDLPDGKPGKGPKQGHGQGNDEHPTTGTTGVPGPSLPGPALLGLCNAYAQGGGGAQGGRNDASSLAALEQAAGVVAADSAAAAAAKVAAYCTTELAKLNQGGGPPSSTGQPENPGRPEDKPPVTTGKPADSGRPEDKPPVSTGGPNKPKPSTTTTVTTPETSSGNPHGSPPGRTNRP